LFESELISTIIGIIGVTVRRNIDHVHASEGIFQGKLTN